MGTIQLPLANTAYQLLERINASPNPPTPDMFNGVQFLSIQANEAGANGTLYYIGNSNLTPTMKGSAISAGQTYPIYSMGSNLIRWDHIYVMSSVANETMNVAFLQK
jgi:hypothetical protein